MTRGNQSGLVGHHHGLGAVPEQAPADLARAVLDRVAAGPLRTPDAGRHAPPS